MNMINKVAIYDDKYPEEIRIFADESIEGGTCLIATVPLYDDSTKSLKHHYKAVNIALNILKMCCNGKRKTNERGDYWEVPVRFI